jgi:hypothetical protein
MRAGIARPWTLIILHRPNGQFSRGTVYGDRDRYDMHSIKKSDTAQLKKKGWPRNIIDCRGYMTDKIHAVLELRFAAQRNRRGFARTPSQCLLLRRWWRRRLLANHTWSARCWRLWWRRCARRCNVVHPPSNAVLLVQSIRRLEPRRDLSPMPLLEVVCSRSCILHVCPRYLGRILTQTTGCPQCRLFVRPRCACCWSLASW